MLCQQRTYKYSLLQYHVMNEGIAHGVLVVLYLVYNLSNVDLLMQLMVYWWS